MVPPKDILFTIRERGPHEEGVNHIISEAIIADPDSFVDVSVKHLAARLGVSEPSIIRYCRSLGCKGFKDFKKYLAQSIVLEEKFTREAHREAPPAPGDVDERYRDMVESAVSALNAAAAKVPFERIDEAAKALSTSSRIAVLGLGGSSSILACETQNRLFRLGLNVTAHSDSYMQRMVAATLDRSGALIVVTSTGEPPSLRDSIETAKSAGAFCLSLAPAESPIARLCDCNLPLELDRSVPYHQPNPIRYAQLFMIDCLAQRLALMLGKSAMNTLRSISSALTKVQPALAYQPTGD